jgi:hypothetical protein
MEKPKITHKMVRRISFMKVSFRKREKSVGQKAGANGQALGHTRQRTTGDNGPSGPQSGKRPQQRHAR